jgi:hypothetical protein
VGSGKRSRSRWARSRELRDDRGKLQDLCSASVDVVLRGAQSAAFGAGRCRVFLVRGLTGGTVGPICCEYQRAPPVRVLREGLVNLSSGRSWALTSCVKSAAFAGGSATWIAAMMPPSDTTLWDGPVNATQRWWSYSRCREVKWSGGASICLLRVHRVPLWLGVSAAAGVGFRILSLRVGAFTSVREDRGKVQDLSSAIAHLVLREAQPGRAAAGGTSRTAGCATCWRQGAMCNLLSCEREGTTAASCASSREALLDHSAAGAARSPRGRGPRKLRQDLRSARCADSQRGGNQRPTPLIDVVDGGALLRCSRES